MVFFFWVGQRTLPGWRSVPVAPPAAAAVARRLLGRPLGSYGIWPVLFLIPGTSGTSTPAGVWHDIRELCLGFPCFCSGAVDHSRLHMAERRTHGTSRVNAGGRALAVCILRTGDHVLHTVGTRRLVRRRRLDPGDWPGTSDSLLGRTCRTAKRGAAWHGTYLCLAAPLFGNLRTVDRHNSDTTCLVSNVLAKVCGTVDTLYRRGTARQVCVWRGTSLQLAALLFGNLHMVDRHSSDTTTLVSPLVSKVCCTVGRLWRLLPPSRWPSANICDKRRHWLWSHTGASGTR